MSAVVERLEPVIERLRAVPVFRDAIAFNLLRLIMVMTFYTFGIQKWNTYTAEMLVPLISHSPIVFWLEPVFGVRGAGFFLGTSELTFGTLILLGFRSPTIGILGALGSIVTFIGTVSIILFLPDAWAKEGGGFPIMTLPLGFLFKDLLFLGVSFNLLEHDLNAVAAKLRPRPKSIP